MSTDSKLDPQRPTSSPAAQDITRAEHRLVYTPKDWDAEAYRNYGEGRNPAPCPVCRRTGFYGPRVVAPDYRYRQCRFCGFTQEAGGAPTEFRPIVHDCKDWPVVAKAPYTWWVSLNETTFHCPFCQAHAEIEQVAVAPPVRDSAHPWWKVPQHRTRFYYARFWDNWDYTKGRAFL
ncbi:MAG TPA: hypothetical protein VGA22_09420 [Gemmatimonadales bacterium]|jgi:hypothetical protein